MGGYLDDDLRVRIADVLGGRRAIEPELRRLAEEGDACRLVLAGELAQRERRLDALTSDPATSLVDIVDELRAVRALRVHVEELDSMLADLDERARVLRASRLAGSGGEAATV